MEEPAFRRMLLNVPQVKLGTDVDKFNMAEKNEGKINLVSFPKIWAHLLPNKGKISWIFSHIHMA